MGGGDGAGGIFSGEAVDGVWEQYPWVRIEWVEGGHYVQEERPDDLAALLHDFTASLPDGYRRRGDGP